ncbi:UBA/TS-N domain containing protein [Histomonas meleagridis]|uniref:UBA/TS-N domain containing protein n=1 Tax=Histomonas meleagridis TaxID=135588 RepID=UPI003559BC34|nr:UBA/TS-N domain containing protein [Histomonas meleagridis]KAH0803877.1 UBA/TS-N domain containing protein [Histomonas meleagridis]
MSDQEQEDDYPEEQSQYISETQEYVISDEDDPDGFEFIDSQPMDAGKIADLETIVNTYSAYMYKFPAVIDPTYTTVSFNLPRTFLPLSLQAVFGFLVHEVILEIHIELDDYDWTKEPKRLSISHPIYGKQYTGRPLVQAAVKKFFSKNFSPKAIYQSEIYLLTPTGEPDEDKVNTLIHEGYDKVKSQNALVLCGNNLAQAKKFLRTGEIGQYESQISVEYKQCPLLYLALEIAECFLDLQDHCCICRAKLPTIGLKPSICGSKMCEFQFTQLGIGNSVLLEIKRDYMAADLLVSIFSAALGTDFLTPPPPPQFSTGLCTSILANLPEMETLSKCENDTALMHKISKEAYELIQWIILSNRSHFVSLPQPMKFKQFGSAFQFLSLISTPEAELEFQKRNEKYGSLYLFHGSKGDRWHSIFRNGLKNASGTKLMANGAALGDGIYFARNSSTSQGYAQYSANNYKNSKFGNTLKILALCQVAKVKELKDHGWAHTLTDEKACVVRFLLVNGQFDVDIIKNPPKNVPKISDILSYNADVANNEK